MSLCGGSAQRITSMGWLVGSERWILVRVLEVGEGGCGEDCWVGEGDRERLDILGVGVTRTDGWVYTSLDVFGYGELLDLVWLVCSWRRRPLWTMA